MTNTPRVPKVFFRGIPQVKSVTDEIGKGVQMKEEAVKIFDLAKKNKLLPTKMEELVPLSFIGNTAVKFYRQKIKLMKDLKMTEEQRKATLKDGQEAGEMLLDIEARIGEICLKEPDAIPKRTFTNGKFKKTSGKPEKHKRLGLPHGMRVSQAQRIAQHPEVVKKIKKKAKEANDIPTKTAVLSEISYQREKKRRKKAEGKRKEIRAVVAIDQVRYLNALDRCIGILPTKPPKKWNEDALKEATAKANIIINRLEVFRDTAIIKDLRGGKK